MSIRGAIWPSVERVFCAAPGALAVPRFGQKLATDAVRRVLARVRPALTAGGHNVPDAAAVAALALLDREDIPNARRVFKLTGTVLHTNLGRTALPEAAITAAAITAMREPVALQYDLTTGTRGERNDDAWPRSGTHRRRRCRRAEQQRGGSADRPQRAGKDDIVFRGELIEIGSSFRLPEMMARAGAKLVEVGATNRTHPHDYAAIGESTAVLMKVHTSNFFIQGFTKAVRMTSLRRWRARNIPLIDLGAYGLGPEPTVQAALLAGADLVTVSSDKLLGGPQCGIIAGRKDPIAQIAR